MTDIKTDAIKDCIRAMHERSEELYCLSESPTGQNAESELAAILDELDMMTQSNKAWSEDAMKYRRRIEEQEKQLAVMREAIVDVTRDCAGESFAEKLESAEGNVRDVGLTKTADYLAELTSALYRAEAALTPDTGKRVVDVAWLQRIEWGGTADIGRGGMRYSHCPDCGAIELDGHDRDCKLAELKGEGANDD